MRFGDDVYFPSSEYGYQEIFIKFTYMQVEEDTVRLDIDYDGIKVSTRDFKIIRWFSSPDTCSKIYTISSFPKKMGVNEQIDLKFQTHNQLGEGINDLSVQINYIRLTGGTIQFPDYFIDFTYDHTLTHS